MAYWCTRVIDAGIGSIISLVEVLTTTFVGATRHCVNSSEIKETVRGTSVSAVVEVEEKN